MLEVEVKAKINCIEDFIQKLKEINGKFLKEEKQKDVYFNHPVRDFAKTDEAIRIRKISEGLNEKFYLTYKGKKIDNETKTREEFESICDEEIFDIFERLGFKKFAEIEKVRKYYKHKNFEICIDEVKDLGNFVEIESKNLNDVEEIFNLLKKFGIKKEDTITESYLELLLKKFIQ